MTHCSWFKHFFIDQYWPYKAWSILSEAPSRVSHGQLRPHLCIKIGGFDTEWELVDIFSSCFICFHFSPSIIHQRSESLKPRKPRKHLTTCKSISLMLLHAADKQKKDEDEESRKQATEFTLMISTHLLVMKMLRGGSWTGCLQDEQKLKESRRRCRLV